MVYNKNRIKLTNVYVVEPQELLVVIEYTVKNFIDYVLYSNDKIFSGIFSNFCGHIEQGKKDFEAISSHSLIILVDMFWSTFLLLCKLGVVEISGGNGAKRHCFKYYRFSINVFFTNIYNETTIRRILNNSLNSDFLSNSISLKMYKTLLDLKRDSGHIQYTVLDDLIEKCLTGLDESERSLELVSIVKENYLASFYTLVALYTSRIQKDIEKLNLEIKPLDSQIQNIKSHFSRIYPGSDPSSSVASPFFP